MAEISSQFKHIENILSKPEYQFKHVPEAHESVNNCIDAVAARKIELNEELKSIVLNVNDELYTFHFKGDEELKSRLLEKHFRKVLNSKVKKIRFATTKEIILSYGATKGAVTPLNEKIWNANNYVSPSLIKGDIVYTNDGTLNGYVSFNSKLLLEMPKNNIKSNNKIDFTMKLQERSKPEAHHALSGLIQTIYTHEHLIQSIKEYHKKSLKKWFSNSDKEKYQYVRIIDTFFSDTLTSRSLVDIIEHSKNAGNDYQIQIILLNPFSEAAIEREESLAQDKNNFSAQDTIIKRLNRGLFKIKRALQNRTDEIPDTEVDDNLKDPMYIYNQLEQIEKIKEDEGYDNFEIRFSDVSSFPVFLISHYAYKGEFLDFISSKDAPWNHYVDDEKADDDWFDQLRKHFESLWKRSKPLQENDYVQQRNKRNIFISYGHDEHVRLKVENIVSNNNFKPILFDNAKSMIDNQKITDILNHMFEISSSAIVILNKDDMQYDGKARARQNVIHELGYAQALYGPLVFLLVEEGVEIPTNLSGYLYSNFKRDDKNNLTINEAEILKFLKRVNRKLNLR